MKPALWSLVALLGACTQPAPVPPCPAVVVFVAPMPEAPKRPAAEVAVVKHFDRAKARELAAVFAPDVTAEQIQRIHAADLDARAALTRLGKHPAKAALDDARVKVQSLEAALDDPPT